MARTRMFTDIQTDGWLDRQRHAIIYVGPLFFKKKLTYTQWYIINIFQLVIKLWHAQDLYIQNYYFFFFVQSTIIITVSLNIAK